MKAFFGYIFLGTIFAGYSFKLWLVDCVFEEFRKNFYYWLKLMQADSSTEDTCKNTFWQELNSSC